MSEKYMRYLKMSGVILLALFVASTGIAQVSPAAEDNIKSIVDDISPYEGSNGPDSVFYGLRITMENMGEFFTFNETEKVKKQIENAEMRIAEAKAEKDKKNTEAMNRALEQYREKIKSVDDSVSGASGEKHELLDLQKRIIKHQLVLRNLSESQPDNMGLENALNNSIRLEEKFELRTRVKLEREIGDDRLMVRVHEVEIEEKEIETEIEDNAAKVKVKVKFIAGGVDRNVIEKEIIEKLKLGKDDIARIMKEVEVSATSTPTSTGTPRATGTGTPRATSTVTGTPGATGTPSSTPEMERPEDAFKIRVESGRSVSEVEAEVRFTLNTVNRDEIINGIAQKLSALKVDDLSKAEIEFDDRREDRRGRDGEVGDDRRGRDGEVGDDRGGRAGEVGDDRGGRAGEVGDDRGGRAGEVGDDRGGSSSGGGSGSGGGGGSSDD